MTEIVSAIVAVLALGFTVVTYRANKNQNRINKADQLLLHINTLTLEGFFSRPVEKEAVRGEIIWNLMQGIYLLGLQNEKHVQLAMRPFVRIYRSSFKINKDSYDSDFTSFIEDSFAKELQLP